MAEWPDLGELKQLLDINTDASDESSWDGDDDGSRLTRVLSSAIDQTKVRIAGTVDAYDAAFTEPTSAHAQGALRLAELIATRPTATPASLMSDPTFRASLYGSRRRFGIA